MKRVMLAAAITLAAALLWTGVAHAQSTSTPATTAAADACPTTWSGSLPGGRAGEKVEKYVELPKGDDVTLTLTHTPSTDVCLDYPDLALEVDFLDGSELRTPGKTTPCKQVLIMQSDRGGRSRITLYNYQPGVTVDYVVTASGFCFPAPPPPPEPEKPPSPNYPGPQPGGRGATFGR